MTEWNPSPEYNAAYGEQLELLMDIAYCENPSADRIRELIEEVIEWADGMGFGVLAEAFVEAKPIFELALETEVENSHFMGRIQKSAQRVLDDIQRRGASDD